MQWGISTSLLPELSTQELARFFSGMAQYGFDGFELACPPGFDFAPARLRQWSRCAENCGINPLSLHAPSECWDLNLPREAERTTGILLRSIEAAARLGAELVVCHPNTCAAITDPAANLASLECTRQLLETCAGEAVAAGVTLAVENMPIMHPPHCPGCCAGELLQLFRNSPPGLAVCYDTGHANVNRLDPAEELPQFGKLLRTVHLHDNMGDTDSHRVPGDGTFPWEKFFATLAETRQNPRLIFEIGGFPALPELLPRLSRFAGRFDPVHSQRAAG